MKEAAKRIFHEMFEDFNIPLQTIRQNFLQRFMFPKKNSRNILMNTFQNQDVRNVRRFVLERIEYTRKVRIIHCGKIE